MDKAQYGDITELVKHILQNQKRIAAMMDALVNRISSILANVMASDEQQEAWRSHQQDSQRQLHHHLDELRSHLDGLEQRVAALEISQTQPDWNTKSRKTNTEVGEHIDGTLPEDLSEALSNWCSLDSPERMESPAELLNQQGSCHFKAVTLAILFANRLAASETLDNRGERQGHPVEEKPGGDHLKATALAIVFMIKLMKAKELPLVLDSQRDITPGSHDYIETPDRVLSCR
ncbi:uncharacterized protein LOC124278484 [Haliotis rubra]|uniref:uncharacterized protein LOC124278484 n=1 Tax=Haliotis rubra TaxID=36100 RepID=UPI001EE5EBD2|nr:uncharacterized protein LOC124278484 [Haliotis rubra]